MSAVLGDIAYTFIPSIIVGLYLGVWLAKHGDSVPTTRQMVWISYSVMIVAHLGAISYALSHHPNGVWEYWTRIVVAVIGNWHACPTIALCFGGLLRLLGVRNAPPH